MRLVLLLLLEQNQLPSPVDGGLVRDFRSAVPIEFCLLSQCMPSLQLFRHQRDIRQQLLQSNPRPRNSGCRTAMDRGDDFPNEVAKVLRNAVENHALSMEVLVHPTPLHLLHHGPQWECVARHRGEALSALSSLFSPCDWVGSSGLCRPYFRLAIGSALSAFVVPIFALRLGRL
jgi:hypothetical protein